MKKKRGRPFEPGNKFGKGRPVGSLNKRSLDLHSGLMDRGPEIVEKTIQLALEGDRAALRLCMERLIPTWQSREARTEEEEQESPVEIHVHFVDGNGTESEQPASAQPEPKPLPEPQQGNLRSLPPPASPAGLVSQDVGKMRPFETFPQNGGQRPRPQRVSKPTVWS